MKLTPYLVFNGQAEEALNFYADIFNGKVENLHRYDSLPDIPDHFKQKILHACLIFDKGSLSAADTMPNDKADFGKLGHMLTLVFDSITEIEDVYAKLCDGAQQVRCELGEAFFAKRYAEVYDKFGVLWALITGDV
jgi:PhnB protein